MRSQLELSAVVWSSSLTDQNKTDLERVQRSALRIILGQKYKRYSNALNALNLETLEERRENNNCSFWTSFNNISGGFKITANIGQNVILFNNIG